LSTRDTVDNEGIRARFRVTDIHSLDNKAIVDPTKMFRRKGKSNKVEIGNSGLESQGVKTRPSNARRIPELDGIRGIAIILVIGCHYEVFARQVWGLPKFGWVGVDIFFVLSGFLITSVLLNLRGRDDSFRVFYSRRFRRILPPYIICIALIYVLSAVLGDHSLFSIRAAAKNALFLQSFGQLFKIVHQVASGGMWRLAHSSLPYTSPGLIGNVSGGTSILWSLSIEEYFYLLWAPAVLWMNRKWLAMTGIAVCLGAFTLRWLGFIGWASYFSIYCRFDALMFGSFVALLISSKLSQKAVNHILVVAGCLGGGILACVLVPMGNVLNLEVRADHIFMVFGIPSLSLMAASAIGLAVTQSGLSHLALLRSWALRFIGTISYTLYLFHGLVYLASVTSSSPPGSYRLPRFAVRSV
jgi:peptidoglycan/LPS O-acetylase OafA/YrhL